MTGYLLDTHALIWWMVEPERLSASALEAINNPNVPTFVSAASAYEIELKRRRDRAFDRLPDALIGVVNGLGLSWLPISAADAYEAGKLTQIHKDPWDRILVAQARNNRLALISVDGGLRAAALEWRQYVLW